MKPFGIPGIGGSLGECALCGQNFLAEIILNKKVKSATIDGINNDLYFHDDCLEKINKIKEWKDLPNGPLRTAYEKNNNKQII